MTANDLTDLTDLSPRTLDLIRRTEDLVKRYPDSEVYEVPEDGDYDFRVIDQRLINAQVCTRKTGEQAAAWLAEVRPSRGTVGGWFLDEQVEPVTCEQFPATHRHFIVEC